MLDQREASPKKEGVAKLDNSTLSKRWCDSTRMFEYNCNKFSWLSSVKVKVLSHQVSQPIGMLAKLPYLQPHNRTIVVKLCLYMVELCKRLVLPNESSNWNACNSCLICMKCTGMSAPFQFESKLVPISYCSYQNCTQNPACDSSVFRLCWELIWFFLIAIPINSL